MNIKQNIPFDSVMDFLNLLMDNHHLFIKNGKLYLSTSIGGLSNTVEVPSKESKDISESIYEPFVKTLEDVKNIYENPSKSLKNISSLQSIMDLIGYMRLYDSLPCITVEARETLHNSKKFLADCLESKFFSELFTYVVSGISDVDDIKELFSYVSKINILPPNFFDIQFEKLYSYMAQMKPDELISYMKKGYISKETISKVISPNDLLWEYRRTKNSKYIKAIPSASLIDLYLNNALSFNELKNASFASNSVLEAISHGISSSDIVALASDEKMRSIFPPSDKLLEAYRKNSINGKAMLELAKLGIINVDLIPEINQIESSLITIPDYNRVTIEDLRNFFTLDTMINLQSKGKLSERLISLYNSSLIPSNEEDMKNFLEIKSQQLKSLELTSANLPSIICLIEKGILTVKDIELISCPNIESLVDSASPQSICVLYSAGKLGQDYLLDISPDSILEFWKKGFLPDSALEILNSPDFISEYNREKLTNSDILYLYNQDLITVYDLPIPTDELNLSILDSQISSEKIVELFVEKKIDYDTLRRLYEDKKISDEIYDRAIDSYRVDIEMDKIRQLAVIQNTAIPVPLYDTRMPLTPSGESPRKKASIDPELRNEFLEALSVEEPSLIISGALSGYSFIPIPALRTVVLEKLYKSNSRNGTLTPALNNATYVLPLIKAIDIATSSNKADLRSLDNVFTVYHTKNWGLNILRSISKVNPHFEYERYADDYSDYIDLIGQSYKENGDD